MNPIKTNSAPGLLLMRCFALWGLLYPLKKAGIYISDGEEFLIYFRNLCRSPRNQVYSMTRSVMSSFWGSAPAKAATSERIK
jgi:hypothetical protein